MSKTLGTESNLSIPIHRSPFHHKTALRLTIHNDIIKTNHINFVFQAAKLFCVGMTCSCVGIALALIDEQLKKTKAVGSPAIVGFTAFPPCNRDWKIRTPIPKLFLRWHSVGIHRAILMSRCHLVFLLVAISGNGERFLNPQSLR